jgi:hypothetical protein
MICNENILSDMKNIYKTITASLLVMVVFALNPVKAGNQDRSGQAAAAHLLINPWAATNGWGTAGISFTKGLEAMYTNVAGMAFAKKTEIGYSNTMYNIGSQTMINGLGLVQSLGRDGDRGNIGLAAMIMSFGEIPRTTVDNPERGSGTFSPIVTSIGLSYALSFSDVVHAGISFKLINEAISDVTATGFTIDAGIQYVSGRNDQFRLGVVLKNIGLPMRYSGDGLALRAYLNRNSYLSTILIPSEASEMPALLGLGISYDFLFGNGIGNTDRRYITRADAMHRLTLAGSYIANAYSKDQFIVGVEYSLLERFQVRGGYTIEGFKAETSTTNLMGPSAGASILIPLNKKDSESPSRIAIDYSYRFTNSWRGSHTIGVRIIL